MHIRILASTDLHEDFDAIKKIIKYSHLADVVVVAGDLSNFGSRLRKVLTELNKCKRPVLIIPGNHEDEIELAKESADLSKIFNIHKSYYLIKNTLFIGFGGDGFSRFNREFRDIRPFFESIIKKKKPEKIVFVTHAPPYNTKLDKLYDEHIGVVDFSDFIKKQKPDLVICGHIHENFGISETIGKTRLINPGKFRMIDLF